MYRNLNVFKSLINTPKRVLPPKHSQFAKAIVTLKLDLRIKLFPSWNPSVFEPRVSGYRGFTSVSIVIQQLFSLLYISRSHEDQVRYSIDVMEFGLTVAILTVVDKSSQAVSFLRGIHAEVKAMRKVSTNLITDTILTSTQRGILMQLSVSLLWGRGKKIK